MDLYVGIPQRLLSGLATVPTCKSRYLGEPVAGVEPFIHFMSYGFLKTFFFFCNCAYVHELHAGCARVSARACRGQRPGVPWSCSYRQWGPSSQVLGMELQLSGRSSKCPSLLGHLSNPVVDVLKIKKKTTTPIPRATGVRTGTFRHPK